LFNLIIKGCMRDNNYLKQKLAKVWQEYFPDVEQLNDVNISFGRKARKRLGSIRATKNPPIKTKILINGYFKSRLIPDYVVEATIAHELCHYAHGFASPLPKLFKYPHRGGSIEKEMKRRGMDELVDMEEDWLSKNWKEYIGYAKA